MKLNNITEILQESLKLEEVKNPRSIYQINKRELIDWLSDHDQAFEDICDFFHIDANDEYCDEELSHYQLSDLLNWISDHKQLYNDMMNHFGLRSSNQSVKLTEGAKRVAQISFDIMYDPDSDEPNSQPDNIVDGFAWELEHSIEDVELLGSNIEDITDVYSQQYDYDL